MRDEGLINTGKRAHTHSLVRVRIASPLQGLTKGRELLEVPEGRFRDLVNALDASYPGFAEMIMKGDRLSDYFIALVNDIDITLLQREETYIRTGDEIVIVPVVAGG